MSNNVGPINIIPDNNQVVLLDNNKSITVVDNNCCTDINVTQPITSVVQVLTGPQGTAGVNGTNGSSTPFSYVSGTTWNTTSSIEITGSFTVSGSNTFKNIGPAQFTGSVNITGSSTLNGFNMLTSNDSILSSSYAVSSSMSQNANTASYYGGSVVSASYATTASFALNGGGSSVDTGSFATTGSNTFQDNQIISGSIYTNGNVTFSGNTFISTTNESGGLYISSLNNGFIGLNTDGGEGDVLVGYSNGWAGKLKVRGDVEITGSLHQSGTFYADQIDVSQGGIVQTTGSYIMTYDSNGLITYATYADVTSALGTVNSSSHALTSSYLNTLSQDLTFNGNLILNGTASITYLNVAYESSSIIYSSG